MVGEAVAGFEAWLALAGGAVGGMVVFLVERWVTRPKLEVEFVERVQDVFLVRLINSGGRPISVRRTWAVFEDRVLDRVDGEFYPWQGGMVFSQFRGIDAPDPIKDIRVEGGGTTTIRSYYEGSLFVTGLEGEKIGTIYVEPVRGKTASVDVFGETRLMEGVTATIHYVEEE